MYYNDPKRCHVCARRERRRTSAPLRPIESEGPLSNVQIDLIDFSNEPDPVTHDRYVCHIRDHFTKYSLLVPIFSKTPWCVKNVILQ